MLFAGTAVGEFLTVSSFIPTKGLLLPSKVLWLLRGAARSAVRGVSLLYFELSLPMLLMTLQNAFCNTGCKIGRHAHVMPTLASTADQIKVPASETKIGESVCVNSVCQQGLHTTLVGVLDLRNFICSDDTDDADAFCPSQRL